MAMVRTKKLESISVFCLATWPLGLRPSMVKQLKKFAASKQGAVADSTMIGNERLGSGIRDYL